jgi:hypothetical protein
VRRDGQAQANRRPVPSSATSWPSASCSRRRLIDTARTVAPPALRGSIAGAKRIQVKASGPHT